MGYHVTSVFFSHGGRGVGITYSRIWTVLLLAFINLNSHLLCICSGLSCVDDIYILHLWYECLIPVVLLGLVCQHVAGAVLLVSWSFSKLCFLSLLFWSLYLYLHFYLLLICSGWICLLFDILIFDFSLFVFIFALYWP